VSEPDIRALIERGSLGTPEAKAIRATASRAQVAKVLARADELERLFAAAKAQLRAEFGDPISVWGREREDAWDTVIGMFVQTGWSVPDA
jgi:hypothetical protein